jgi:DNA repair protein RecO
MSGSFKAKGLVLKEIKTSNSDKLLIVFLKYIGKISILSRGARLVKNKILISASAFSYSQFVVKPIGSYYVLKEVSLIRSFYGLNRSYESFCYAAYFCELCEKFIPDMEPFDDMLLFLLHALRALEHDKLPYMLIRSIFELKFLQDSGYMPNAHTCTCCSALIKYRCRLTVHGFYCEHCHVDDTCYEISHESLIVFKYILDSKVDSSFRFTVDKEITSKIAFVTDILVNFHLGYSGINSKKFIKQIESSQII